MLRALDVPAFAIKSPIVVDRISPYDGLSLDEVDFLTKHTDKQVKVPLPGPYLLLRSSWFEGLSDKAYPDQDDLADDIVKILRQEIVSLKERGVDFIQFDEPTLSQVVLARRAPRPSCVRRWATAKTRQMSWSWQSTS